jgi:hypothetical protein
VGNPVPFASDQQLSPGNDLSTLTSSAATASSVANGDVIVVHLSTWSSADGMTAPTGGGQTFQAAQITAPGGFNGWAATYVCTVSGSPGAFSISSSPATANTSRHMMVVERYKSAVLAATPAVLSAPTSGVAGSPGSVTLNITTTAANSIVSWNLVDLSSSDPAGVTYSPAGSTQSGLYDAHVGSNSVQYAVYSSILASAGANTVGLAVVSGALTWVASGVEVKAATAATVDLAANLTATGGMTDALTREVPLAASLAGNGSLTAALVREADLAATLAGAGSMTAPMVNETHLAATLAANGSMSAALSVPTLGPPDLIATPVATALLACLTDQMNQLPDPPAKIQLRVGSETGPLVGPNVDECCAGLAWVRVANVYPSWNNFPGPDNDWLPCGPLAYAVVLEMGSAFCMPWSDSGDTWENLDPPSTQDWTSAFGRLMQRQNLMRRAAACCFPPTQRRAVGEWSPLPVEGGCTGGTLLVTVSVMAPCSDC